MAYQHWQQRGEPGAHRVHLPARRLPRRHDRLGLGRRDRPVPRDVPAAAVRDPPRRAGRRRRHARGCSRRTASASPRSWSSRSSRARPACSSHPDGYLRAVRELCDEFGVLLICDEVAVGFGRTGTMFACQQEDVAPDLMCVAKGITGGYLPLAATLTTEAVYAAFLGEHEEYRTFFHGHTYTGNPLACAAALATLDVFESERTLERLAPKIELLGELLDELVAPLPAVARDPPARLHDRDRAGAAIRPRRAWATRSRSPRAGAARSCARSATSSCSCRRSSITADELTRLVAITAAAIEEATGAAAVPARRLELRAKRTSPSANGARARPSTPGGSRRGRRRPGAARRGRRAAAASTPPPARRCRSRRRRRPARSPRPHATPPRRSRTR